MAFNGQQSSTPTTSFRSYQLITKKKISSVVAEKVENKEIFVFSRGNPRKLLQRCKRILIDGKKLDLDKSTRNKIYARIKKYNSKGQKVIAFAYKGLPRKKQSSYSPEFCENDLIFLGMIGFGHALNTDLKKQIETIKELGIKIYILARTNERHSITAGLDMGIINPKYFEALNSGDLHDLNDEKLAKMLANKEKDYIFNELTEADRNRIIKTLQKNDPRLKIVSTTDHKDFKKLIDQIEISRIHQENAQKILKHNLGTRIPLTLLALLSLFLNMPIIFNLTLLLFIEIFINLPLELAIQTEKPAINVLSQHYHEQRKQTQIPFSRSVVTISISATALGFFLIYSGGWNFFETVSSNNLFVQQSATAVLSLLIILQTLNAYRMRQKNSRIFNKHSLENHYLLAISLLTAIILYALNSLIELQEILALAPLQISHWQMVIYLTAIFLTIIEIWPRLRSRILATSE